MQGSPVGVCVGKPCLFADTQKHVYSPKESCSTKHARGETVCEEKMCVRRKQTDSISKTYLTMELFFVCFHVIKLVVPFRFRNTGTLYFMASMKMT